MTVNVDSLIEDAKQARLEAQKEAEAAAKVAATVKKNKGAINKARLQAEPKIAYVKALESQMVNLEGTLQNYARKIAMGDKLTPTEKAEFNRSVSQYKKLSGTYTNTNNSIVKILGGKPGIDVVKLTGNKDLANKTVDKEGNVVDTPVAGTGTVNFDWSKYTVDANGVQGPVIVAGKPETGQAYLVVTPTDKGNMVTPYGNATEARAAFVKAFYSQPGGIEKLKNDLHNASYINDKQFNSNDYLSGIDLFLANYAKHQIQDVTIGGQAEETPMMTFMANKSMGLGGTGGGSGGKRQVITNRGDAKKLLDGYLDDWLGRTSTPKEEDDFYKELHLAQSKAVQQTTNGVTTGELLSPTDYMTMAASVAKKSLKGTDVAKLLDPKNPKGSKMANDINDLQSYATAYGVTLSQSDALKYAAAGLGQADLNKQKERIRQTAMVIHPYLKEHFAAGGTYVDVASQYSEIKQRKLGTLVRDPGLDADIKSAIAAGKSTTDFEKEMQAKPEWRLTKEAHDVAADFTQTILRSFGFGG